MAQSYRLGLFEELDSLINQFQMEKAREVLRQLDYETIPSAQRANFASLARRCGELKMALKILHHQIFGAGRPTQVEIIEYASSVRRLGLINQAITQLERLEECGKVHLHKAFCAIHQWDYRKALIDLEKALSFADLTTKEILVAQVNRLTCVVEVGDYETALSLLDELEQQCKEGSPHLYLNCLETRGQVYYRMNRIDEAIAVLERAHEIAGIEQGQTKLFIDKWLVISHCRSGDYVEISPEVIGFAKEIRQAGHWETLRDYNWQVAQVFGNTTKMKQVFFGTPFPAFRQAVLEQNPEFEIPDYYLMMDSRSPEGTEQVFDFFKAEEVPFAFGKNLHRLMMILCSDFYQPWSITRIFDSLFPEDVFDPHSSHKRVYRLLEKLDKEIKKHDIKLDLHSTSQGYRLRPLPGCLFKVYPKMVFESREEFLVEVLNQANVIDGFGINEVKNIIPLTEHQWYRALRKMAEQGHIYKVNAGESLYKIKKSS